MLNMEESLARSLPAGLQLRHETDADFEFIVRLYASTRAEEQGIRVVHARLGVVLTPAGGALAKMLLPFRLGVGGVVGDGSQYMSWITCYCPGTPDKPNLLIILGSTIYYHQRLE